MSELDAALYAREVERLTRALEGIRDHHVKHGPFNTDGSMCNRCQLCGANIDKGEKHEDPRFSCAMAESALRAGVGQGPDSAHESPARHPQVEREEPK